MKFISGTDHFLNDKIKLKKVNIKIWTMNFSPNEKQLASILQGMDGKTLFFNSNDLLIEPTLSPDYSESENHPHLHGIYLSEYLPHFIHEKVQALKRHASDQSVILQGQQELYVLPSRNRYGQMEYMLILSGKLYKLSNAFYQLKCSNWSNEGIFEYALQQEMSYFSEKFVALLHHDKENKDLAHTSIKKLLHPDDINTFDKAIQKASEKEHSFCFSVRLLSGKRRYKWFEFCGRSFTMKNPDDVIFLCKTSDITNYKTEIENLKKEKFMAVRSNQFRTQFLKKFSHSIRTPLNSISGFSGMILEDDFSTDEKKEFVQIIERNSEQLVNMVSDFTETIRIENKDIELYPRFFDPKIPMLNLFGEFEARKESLNKKHIKLVINFPEDFTPFRVHADKARFIQVFNQLLDNAVKFTNEGSITFGYQMKRDKIWFYVQDTGIGIAPSEKDTIFALYNEYTVDNQFEQFKNGGTGLYICKNIVELMQGEINFKSKAGEGTRFQFSLPYKKARGNTNVSKRLSSHQNEGFKWAGKKILIVDDAKEIHHFVKLTLKNTSVTCLYADSGDACINLFQSISDIDVILLDIQMPGQNGIETIKKIHEIKPNMPVIALTAHALTGDEDGLKKFGFSEYISKPIKRGALFRSLRQVLSS